MQEPEVNYDYPDEIETIDRQRNKERDASHHWDEATQKMRWTKW